MGQIVNPVNVNGGTPADPFTLQNGASSARFADYGIKYIPNGATPNLFYQFGGSASGDGSIFYYGQNGTNGEVLQATIIAGTLRLRSNGVPAGQQIEWNANTGVISFQDGAGSTGSISYTGYSASRVGTGTSTIGYGSIQTSDGTNQTQILAGHMDADLGFRSAEIANGKQGIVNLVGGTATVNNNRITANSRIFLTSQQDGGAPGFVRVSSRVVGASFTITSSSNTDTSTIAYEIFEPK